MVFCYYIVTQSLLYDEMRALLAEADYDDVLKSFERMEFRIGLTTKKSKKNHAEPSPRRSPVSPYLRNRDLRNQLANSKEQGTR